MQTIYNAQGEEKVCEAVDAREHIASGRWFSSVQVPEPLKEEPQKRAYNKKAE